MIYCNRENLIYNNYTKVLPYSYACVICKKRKTFILCIYRKICVDALSSHVPEIPWRIKSVCIDITVTMSQNPNISIRWIAREANCAANALAKWSLKNNVFCNFDLGSGFTCFVFVF